MKVKWFRDLKYKKNSEVNKLGKYFERVMLINRSREVGKTFTRDCDIQIPTPPLLIYIFSFPRNLAITPQT